MSLNKTILLALALIPLAIPAASAGPIVCLGTGCPGAIGMCLDDVSTLAECAGVPPVNCPAITYSVEADPVVVYVGPCGSYSVFYDGERVLP